MQCGSPGTWGAALCLDSPEVPESCDAFVGNDDPETTAGGEDCLVGDIMYRHGDSVGFIGETCTGESAFTGTESFCQDGQVRPPLPSPGPLVSLMPRCRGPGSLVPWCLAVLVPLRSGPFFSSRPVLCYPVALVLRFPGGVPHSPGIPWCLAVLVPWRSGPFFSSRPVLCYPVALVPVVWSLLS